jgi:hypothetical protein
MWTLNFDFLSMPRHPPSPFFLASKAAIMILPALAVTKLARHMTLSDINVWRCESAVRAWLLKRGFTEAERDENNIILPQRAFCNADTTRFLDGVSPLMKS